MNVLKCEFCGKTFVTKSSIRKFCSKNCACRARKKRQEENEQLCCTCKKACGGCSWSDFFLPVKGWDAIATVVKDGEGNFSSYKIKECPQYIWG